MQSSVLTNSISHENNFQTLGKNFYIYFAIKNSPNYQLRSCHDDTMSLLFPNTNHFIVCTAFPQCEGAYLYYDKKLGAFVRSGKVTEPSFSVRHKEHDNESQERNANSNFNFLHSLQEVANHNVRCKQGVVT